MLLTVEVETGRWSLARLKSARVLGLDVLEPTAPGQGLADPLSASGSPSRGCQRGAWLLSLEVWLSDSVSACVSGEESVSVVGGEGMRARLWGLFWGLMLLLNQAMMLSSSWALAVGSRGSRL
ncbi:hypothetical protein EYF80_003913 [Liparis tanakae]|uniref:Uncharacterized protein n=1 Tax=Liparis tanakae TaxID=230148 RepID=A0A4Z2J657_9TELE|nr:hypothetical protein EYF80_003913 [Liparis tanakae]